MTRIRLFAVLALAIGAGGTIIAAGSGPSTAHPLIC